MKKYFKNIVVGMIATTLAISICGFKHVSGGGNPEDWEFDNTQYVFDYAEVLTDDEELELQSRCEKLSKKLDMDIVILSAKDRGDKTDAEYADDFYDYGGYKESGILYLIDEDDGGGVYISTCGLAMVYLDDYDIEDLIDAVWDEFANYDYFGSAEDYLKYVEDVIGDRKKQNAFEKLEDAWYEGEYDDYEDFWYDYDDEIYDAFEGNLFTGLQNVGVCFLIALIVAAVSVLIMCISSSAKVTVNSRTYMENGSFKLLHQFDRYTHTTTTSHKVDTSSGGGGSRGGSSSHRSSSGRSHGGGGRRR